MGDALVAQKPWLVTVVGRLCDSRFHDKINWGELGSAKELKPPLADCLLDLASRHKVLNWRSYGLDSRVRSGVYQ